MITWTTYTNRQLVEAFGTYINLLEAAMTTDNRMNEPTEAQVKAAAKAAYEFDADVSELFGKGFRRDFDGMPQWARDTHLDKARAALEAADAVMKRVDEDGRLPVEGENK